MLAKLFTKMLSESLNEYAYAADIAGLTYEISNSANGFELRMKGYNDKQPVLLQKIFERFRTLVIDLDMFSAILESVRYLVIAALTYTVALRRSGTMPTLRWTNPTSTLCIMPPSARRISAGTTTTTSPFVRVRRPPHSPSLRSLTRHHRGSVRRRVATVCAPDGAAPAL